MLHNKKEVKECSSKAAIAQRSLPVGRGDWLLLHHLVSPFTYQTVFISTHEFSMLLPSRLSTSSCWEGAGKWLGWASQLVCRSLLTSDTPVSQEDLVHNNAPEILVSLPMN